MRVEMDTYLRKATEADKDLLFRWANDETVRKNAFSMKRIPYQEHCAWFAHALDCDTIGLYIYMQGETPVGQIRVNAAGNEAEISYSVDMVHRGQGHGTAMVALLNEQVRKDFPNVKILTAKVKTQNQVSRSVFQKNGFSSYYECFSKKV